MGLVEEIDTPIGIEKEDLDEAANANFVDDRETNPNISNPNTIKNPFALLGVRMNVTTLSLSNTTMVMIFCIVGCI